MMGFPVTFLVASRFFLVGGVRCSRSYREGGQRTSLPIGPATAAEPESAKRRAYSRSPPIGRTR
jgi:hypothetical protein